MVKKIQSLGLAHPMVLWENVFDGCSRQAILWQAGPEILGGQWAAIPGGHKWLRCVGRKFLAQLVEGGPRQEQIEGWLDVELHNQMGDWISSSRNIHICCSRKTWEMLRGSFGPAAQIDQHFLHARAQHAWVGQLHTVPARPDWGPAGNCCSWLCPGWASSAC